MAARPGQTAGVGPFLDDRLRAAVQRRLATLLQDPAGRGAGLATLTRLLERWASPGDASEASLQQRHLEEHIKAMLAEISFLTGDAAAAAVPPALQPWEASAVELTDVEIATLQAGKKLADPPDPNFRIPPPREYRGAPDGRSLVDDL